MIEEKLCRWLIGPAVALLAITAALKAVAATGEARILGQPDPLLGLISMRQSMLLAAALEIVVVVLVLRAPDIVRKAALLLWIGAVFLVYRIGLWWVGFEGSCRCLGNVGDVFGISAERVDWIAKGILVYLLVGSGAILLWYPRFRGHTPNAGAAMQVGADTDLSFTPEAGRPRS
jgi:hypothetical protein